MFSSTFPGNPFYKGNDADTKKQVHFHKDTLVIVASNEVSENWRGKNLNKCRVIFYSFSHFFIKHYLLSLKEYLNMLSGTKVQRGILIFSGPMSNDKLNELNAVLDEHNTNTFFYMVYNVASTDSNAKKPIDKGPYHMIWNQVLKESFFLDWKQLKYR